jgi:hypothetical protein
MAALGKHITCGISIYIDHSRSTFIVNHRDDDPNGLVLEGLLPPTDAFISMYF